MSLALAWGGSESCYRALQLAKLPFSLLLAVLPPIFSVYRPLSPPSAVLSSAFPTLSWPTFRNLTFAFTAYVSMLFVASNVR